MIFIFPIVTKTEIVERIAREQRVETMLSNIAKCPVTGDLRDLCQMVYLILLEYDESKIIDLWEHNQINFFIARILLNQYKSSNSPFYKLFRKPDTVFLHLFDEHEIHRYNAIRVDIAGYYRSQE